MKNRLQKRYILLGVVVIVVIALVWKLGSSFAYVNKGFSGKNIISGDKWGVNIVEIGDVLKKGNAELIGDVSTIGTTLSFDAMLFNPGDEISFDVTVENTSSLNAELYALTLTGLSMNDSEFITYTILPIDSSMIHENDRSGSIIKSGEKQMFNITVKYDDNAKVVNEYNLNLGSTIVYKQV